MSLKENENIMEATRENIRECKLYKLVEVAEMLGLSRVEISRRVAKKEIKSINKEGHKTRILGRDLIEYLK